MIVNNIVIFQMKAIVSWWANDLMVSDQTKNQTSTSLNMTNPFSVDQSNNVSN